MLVYFFNFYCQYENIQFLCTISFNNILFSFLPLHVSVTSTLWTGLHKLSITGPDWTRTDRGRREFSKSTLLPKKACNLTNSIELLSPDIFKMLYFSSFLLEYLVFLSHDILIFYIHKNTYQSAIYLLCDRKQY